jgi:hypothetical protein
MSGMSEPMDPTAASPTESFIDEYLDSTSAIDKRRALRQGLPHRPSDTPSGTLAFPTSIPVTFALRDMSQELEGVASCFNLVATKARPLRERLGLSLARVGVQRNMRAFQALRVLLEDPAPEPAPISLNTIVEQTIKSFDEELLNSPVSSGRSVRVVFQPASRSRPLHGSRRRTVARLMRAGLMPAAAR